VENSKKFWKFRSARDDEKIGGKNWGKRRKIGLKKIEKKFCEKNTRMEKLDFDGKLALTAQGFLKIETGEVPGNPKKFVREIGGEIWELEDFWVPVIHKKSVKILAWKDLGAGMLVPRAVENRTEKLGWSSDAAEGFRAGVQLLRGFDEDRGEKYARVGKISAEQRKNFEIFCGAVGETLKIEAGRVVGSGLGARAEEIFANFFGEKLGEDFGKNSGENLKNLGENFGRNSEEKMGQDFEKKSGENCGKNSSENF